jgi:hypothetical protein
MAQPVELALPELFCPFPSAVSPHAHTVDEATIAWARSLGLLGEPSAVHKLRVVGVGWLVARTTPYMGRDGLQLLADWCTWLFLQDDDCDELGIGREPAKLRELHAHSLATLRGDAFAPDSPSQRALSDLRERIVRLGCEDRIGWFLRTVEQSFDASIWEAANRAGGIVPSVKTYIAQRAFTGGMLMVLSLTTIADGIVLPPAVREHPVVAALTRCTTNAVCWANDIISLAKELQQGDVHNLVVVLRHEYQLVLTDAIYRAAALHDAQVREFLDLQRRLPSFGGAADAHLKRYVDILRFWMRGNLDWANSSGRYLEAVRDGGGMLPQSRTVG